MMRCCFDKRVWIGLGALAAGLLIAGPPAGLAALPVIIGLACPVSMLVMIRSMRQGTGSARSGGQAAAGPAEGGRAAGIARLRHDISELKAHTGNIPLAAAQAEPVARGAAGIADPAGRGRTATGA